MEQEIWKEVSEFVGIYEVSNTGKVRCIDRDIIRSNGRPTIVKGRELYMGVDKYGYRIVQFNVNRKRYVRKVHRLVYEAFIGRTEKGLVIDHIDNNKMNNNADNLQQVTNRINVSKDRNRILPTGVYKNSDGRGYRTVFQADNINIYIGTFKTIQEAESEYEKALHNYNTLGIMPEKVVQRNVFNKGMKICPVCGISKPISDYYIASKNKGTRHAKCKKCIIEYNKSRN